jgi:hypothetical protein
MHTTTIIIHSECDMSLEAAGLRILVTSQYTVL